MSIVIPSNLGIIAGDPTLIDFGGLLVPPMGGVEQKLNRIGNRFSLKVQLPPLISATDGRIAISRLAQAVTQGAIFAFPQSLKAGTPGTVLVNGAGQTGSTLALDGFVAGYVAREGQFFSLQFGGRNYLHGVAADTTANASGQMSLPIWPMLRVSPSDNSPCAFAAPVIEGFLADGNGLPWSVPASPYLNVAFTIREAA